MYRIVSGMIVCLYSCATWAQPCVYHLNVKVVERHTRNAVFAATVQLAPSNSVFQTDEHGRFTADSLCAGTYAIRVVAAGYAPYADTITILGDTAVQLRVKLTDHVLEEFQITEEHNRTLQQQKEKLSKADLDARSGKSLGDLLQAVNGVTTLTNGATIVKPVIHGLYSNRIVTVNNGIRQEDQQWGGEHAPDIDPFLANNITVIKGAAGVRYGTDAIGGVVLVEPAALRHTPGWDGELNLAGFSNNRMGVASGMIQRNFKRMPALSVRLQGTWKKGGNYRIPGYWAANTGVKEVNYSATLGYHLLHYGGELFYSHFSTDLGIYRGSHTGNQSDLMNAINSPVPLIPSGFTYDLGRPMQHVSHDLAKLKLYADTRVGLWNVTYGFQHNFRQEYDVLRVETGQAQLNLTLNTQSLNINLDHKPVKGISGQIGVDGVYQDNFFRDGDRLFIPAYTSGGAAGYVIERYKKHNYSIEGGLRFDYRSYSVQNPQGSNQQLVHYGFDYRNFSGTLNFQQRLSAVWEWSATLANAWRAPQASELFSSGLHEGTARVELGNKDLRPERSHSLNLETKLQKQNKWSADIALYSQLIDDFIFLEPGPDLLTIRGYYKTFSYRQTNAWLNGADVSMRYLWTPELETALKGSLLRARDMTAHDWIILMPADRVSFSARYTKDVSSRLRQCYLSIDPRYVLQQIRVPRNFDSIDYPRPPKDYFLLDASVGACIAMQRAPVYLSLTVTNMLNTTYRDYLDVFRYFINQPGTNIVLRVRIPFDHQLFKKP